MSLVKQNDSRRVYLSKCEQNLRRGRVHHGLMAGSIPAIDQYPLTVKQEMIHLPGHLRDAFRKWTESGMDADKPIVVEDEEKTLGWLVQSLWNCSDILPSDCCKELGIGRVRHTPRQFANCKDYHVRAQFTQGPHYQTDDELHDSAPSDPTEAGRKTAPDQDELR
jgi:hypothetical protein